MKKLIKPILLVLFLLSYFFIPAVGNIFKKEINYLVLSSYLAKNLHEQSTQVAAEPTVVIDYVVEGNRLYVFPMEKNVSLPIDVMVAEMKKDEMEVILTDMRFKISHFTKSNCHLYQYVNANKKLATTEDYYIVEGDNLESIYERLTIYYEKI